MFQQDSFQQDAFQIGDLGVAADTGVPNSLMMMGQGLAVAMVSKELLDMLDMLPTGVLG